MNTRADQPLYQVVKDHILRHIQSGQWRASQRVPSEHELVRDLGVSRMTANRALRELSALGILKRVAGIGTFVADLKVAGHPLTLRNIAEEIRERGHVHRSKLISLERVAPPEPVRERLALPRGQRQVFHSVIVHHENDIPLQLEDRYVNPALAPGYMNVDFARVTPNEYLTEVAPLQRVEHTVKAVAADARTRKLLELRRTEPVLLIERVTWSGGARASFALLQHPADRYELSGDFSP
jgi:GntR family histidine utilization transcriptional repressor